VIVDSDVAEYRDRLVFAQSTALGDVFP